MRFNDKKSLKELTKYHFKNYWNCGDYTFDNQSGYITITKWHEVEVIIEYPSDKEGRKALQKVFARLVLDNMIIF